MYQQGWSPSNPSRDIGFSVTDVTGGTTGTQPNEASSLSASSTTSDAGPLISWVRQSPYTMDEISLVLDGLLLLAYAYLMYREVTA